MELRNVSWTISAAVEDDRRVEINPFNASCSKVLLFEGFSAILV